MATKSAKKSGSRGAAKEAASGAPRTGTPTGAGPEVGGTPFSGRPPALSEERHGGQALVGEPPKGASPAAGQAEDTGPVVENTGGGLSFERKPSGTRSQPRKEQPTTPERAEVVEGRRLEQEIQKSKVNAATDPASGGAAAAKVGDRVRVLRSAASGWELGTIKYLSEGGAAGAAELDGGETVGLETGRWEPAVGALAAPQLDRRDLKSEGGLIDREGQDRAANQAEAMGNAVKSAQSQAKPARARASRAKSAKKASKPASSSK